MSQKTTGAAESGYYAPLTVHETLSKGAWRVEIGQTPDGKWVAEYHSTASPRYQRQYFATLDQAREDTRWLR